VDLLRDLRRGGVQWPADARAASGSCRRRRLGDDDGEVDDEHLVDGGHEGGGEGGVAVVGHVGGEVGGGGEGEREDVREALRQHLLVQHVLAPARTHAFVRRILLSQKGSNEGRKDDGRSRVEKKRVGV
jgi:dienelactone hydrolase